MTTATMALMEYLRKNGYGTDVVAARLAATPSLCGDRGRLNRDSVVAGDAATKAIHAETLIPATHCVELKGRLHALPPAPVDSIPRRA